MMAMPSRSVWDLNAESDGSSGRLRHSHRCIVVGWLSIKRVMSHERTREA